MKVEKVKQGKEEKIELWIERFFSEELLLFGLNNATKYYNEDDNVMDILFFLTVFTQRAENCVSFSPVSEVELIDTPTGVVDG